MPENDAQVNKWADVIRARYERYLKTLFYFKDPSLRKSFTSALEEYNLMRQPIPEQAQNFVKSVTAKDLAEEYFPNEYDKLLPALRDEKLYSHQEHAIRAVFGEKRNVVVATGTASGKTESFLYPVLFELYRQYIDGKLKEPGVRALILYPMNALANDQRERLGDIFGKLEKAGSEFAPKFGQYIGATPKNRNDKYKQGEQREAERLPGEFVHREEMRKTPPHILLTNYSMLEYLLIRPEDSELFDGDRGKFWQFLVLDEAHQYRGVKGMEMSMLIRRLKQRLVDGGQNGEFRCIATSATLASDEENSREDVGNFAKNLFGESYNGGDVIFGDKNKKDNDGKIRRYHIFMCALEGAFLIHRDDKDQVILNRKAEGISKPLEIALCRECGQHYYVGRKANGYLEEARRDPGGTMAVEFYLPLEEPLEESSNSCDWLCRVCGKISSGKCSVHDANIKVQKCESNNKEPDQLKKCVVCNYTRGSMGDPVREIVHGKDGPNTVIATALLTQLPKGERRKILSFADSRQEAAFFAWYVQDTYEHIRNRNLIWRAFCKDEIPNEGFSVDDLATRIANLPETGEWLPETDTELHQKREILMRIFQELVTTERGISLSGVGLVKWTVKIPEAMKFPPEMFEPPWNFSPAEARELIGLLLDDLRNKCALSIPDSLDSPTKQEIFGKWNQRQMVSCETRDGARTWVSDKTGMGKFVARLLTNKESPTADKDAVKKLMHVIWDCIWEHDKENPGCNILTEADPGCYYLNHKLLRAKLPENVYECETCANINVYNIRDACPRWRCGGKLIGGEPLPGFVPR